jgi:DNA polymerase
MIDWTHPDPVFYDLESQSAADLKAVGGRLYAQDPSTRILTAVFFVDGVYHVWIPTHTTTAAAAAAVSPGAIWPHQLGSPKPIQVHYGDTPPVAVQEAVRARRTFVAHNCFGFDRFVWEAAVVDRGPAWPGNVCPPWADTVPMARAAGLRASLDAVAQDLVGEGKDAGKRILMKHVHAERAEGGYRYPAVGAGSLEVILRYNVADVDLLRRAWLALEQLPVEADVIEAHDRINSRGVGVDVALAQKLVSVGGASVGRAAAKIAELTGGVLTAANLRSTKQVNEWLDSKGVRVRDYAGKRTLRKDFVAQAIANPWLMLDEDAPAAAVDSIDPTVFEVLRLRSAALRITSAKGERAVLRAGADGRARDLHTYHQAHTGRFSSAGIQIHNLPRPRKGVPVDLLLTLHGNDGQTAAGHWSAADSEGGYDLVSRTLADGVNVDDALSSLLRPLFIPAPGHCFAVADYAAVECRGVAWIAGEEGLLHTLATGGDVYKDMAARIFGVDAADVTDAQRQVGKVTILGCGYSMSAEKFGLYCGLQRIDLAAAGTSAAACVEAFRAAYPAIAGTYAGAIDGVPYRSGGVWWKLAKAAMSAMTEGGVHEAGKTRWAFDGCSLVCTLPSGRQLRYRNARVEDRIPGYAKAVGSDRTKATLVYDGAFSEAALYGGKICENVVQAICRDLLATALVNCERAGLPVVLHVHDEIVAEVPVTAAAESLDTLVNVMTTAPDWAAGFPISAEGFCAPRYLKAAPKGWPKAKKM